MFGYTEGQYSLVKRLHVVGKSEEKHLLGTYLQWFWKGVLSIYSLVPSVISGKESGRSCAFLLPFGYHRYTQKNKQFGFRTNFGEYRLVETGKVSPRRVVPDDIRKPSYYATGLPSEAPQFPEVKSESQIQKMRESCRLAANILKNVENIVQVR